MKWIARTASAVFALAFALQGPAAAGEYKDMFAVFDITLTGP